MGFTNYKEVKEYSWSHSVFILYSDIFKIGKEI